jgi:hypothetical protein
MIIIHKINDFLYNLFPNVKEGRKEDLDKSRMGLEMDETG